MQEFLQVWTSSDVSQASCRPQREPQNDAASEVGSLGIVVLVAPGVYQEAIVISGKRITLASEFQTTGDPARIEDTILEGGGNGVGDVINVSSNVQPPGARVIGFTIRNVGRRLNGDVRSPRELPRSVEQLTELVGRVSLKDLVRETTDLIERLCIEAALELTHDNRASAAEMLGLSRQSLYVKLRRYGLVSPDEPPEV